MVYRKIEEGTMKWQKEGDQIEGQLVKIEENVGPNNSVMYTVKQTDGSIVKAWGATILDGLMAGIAEGTQVRITLIGFGPKKGGKAPTKLFTVEVDDGAETDVDPGPQE